MMYYILLPGESSDVTIRDDRTLGESSFKTFYPGLGFKLFESIVDKTPGLLQQITIISSDGTKHTPEEFLSILSTLKFRLK